MSSDTFLVLLVFSFVTSITPGPNNFMLLASGVKHGFRRTIPHMPGIALGFASLLLGVGFGLGTLLAAYPSLHTLLKVLGGVYLLYLAWRIGMSRSLGKGRDDTIRPMSFFEAAAFQWVNPKGWVMAVTAMAVYTSAQTPFLSVLFVTLAFSLVNLPCAISWTAFGLALRGFLSDPVRLKWFNIAMGVALALTLWPMLR